MSTPGLHNHRCTMHTHCCAHIYVCVHSAHIGKVCMEHTHSRLKENQRSKPRLNGFTSDTTKCDTCGCGPMERGAGLSSENDGASRRRCVRCAVHVCGTGGRSNRAKPRRRTLSNPKTDGKYVHSSVPEPEIILRAK